MSAAGTNKDSAAPPPVVIIKGDYDASSHSHDDVHKNKKQKTSTTNGNGASTKHQPTNHNNDDGNEARVFHPDSPKLLDDMLHPLSKQDFLSNHFRKNAVHIQRSSHNSSSMNKDLVSDICNNYLFNLNVKDVFAETSSENVFLWLRPPPLADATSTALNSVEISDPETAYALHKSGSHPAYCRAPPILEQHLVGSLLRATGLGGGHYHPPHSDSIVTLGGNTTLGRGEVELFISTSSASSGKGEKAAAAAAGKGSKKEEQGDKNSGGKKHTTGWHTDFQENFTIQLSGIKRWTLRRGRIPHPLRATTPHYARDASVIENQLKVARLSCLSAVEDNECAGKKYGFEYGDNNAYGPEQTITLYPGDVFYFPSGMWHTVESIEPGCSLNVSLMGTTYATLVCESLQHLLVGSEDPGWREVITSRPGGVNGAERLQELLGGLSSLVDNFVNSQGGAQSLLPPALCHPPLGNDDEEEEEEEEESHEDDEHDDDMDGDDSKEAGGDEKSNSSSGSMHNMQEESDGEEDALTSGIIIPLDDFVGPSSWTCQKPNKKSKLVRNPLANLMDMSDVTRNCQQQQSGKISDDDVQYLKQYVLNVNYAGNEMTESHIRVMLETSNPESIELMEWFVQCDAEGGLSPSDLREKMPKNLSSQEIPLCLFFYGYLS